MLQSPRGSHGDVPLAGSLLVPAPLPELFELTSYVKYLHSNAILHLCGKATESAMMICSPNQH